MKAVTRVRFANSDPSTIQLFFNKPGADGKSPKFNVYKLRKPSEFVSVLQKACSSDKSKVKRRRSKRGSTTTEPKTTVSKTPEPKDTDAEATGQETAKPQAPETVQPVKGDDIAAEDVKSTPNKEVDVEKAEAEAGIAAQVEEPKQEA